MPVPNPCVEAGLETRLHGTASAVERGTIAAVRPIRIDSSDDERLWAFRNVPDPELLSRLGLFVAEGRLVVARLLASRLETRALLVTEPALAALQNLIAHATCPVYAVPQDVMNGVTGFNFHRGCLALGVRPPIRDWREVAEGVGDEQTNDSVSGAMANDSATLRPSAPLLLALERVGNVDNVGAIFRNAAAFGARGLLLQADCADPLYRKAIRTSMAASLVTPYAAVPWPDVLHDLHGRGWATVAMTPAAGAPLLQDVSAALTGKPIVVVLGHEGEGLTSGALEACTHLARIAVAGSVDSVNVATAAAIALYELARGRASSAPILTSPPD